MEFSCNMYFNTYNKIIQHYHIHVAHVMYYMYETIALWVITFQKICVILRNKPFLRIEYSDLTSLIVSALSYWPIPSLILHSNARVFVKGIRMCSGSKIVFKRSSTTTSNLYEFGAVWWSPTMIFNKDAEVVALCGVDGRILLRVYKGNSVLVVRV